MQTSKPIFLSKIAISLILFVFVDITIVRVLLLIFVFLDGVKDSAFFLLLALMTITGFSYRYDVIPIGIVDRITTKTVLVEKGLYRVRIYDSGYKSGDVLVFTGAAREESAQEQMNNVLFKSDKHYRKIGSLRLRKLANDRISGFNEELQSAVKRIVTNDYADSELKFGQGFYFYYFLLLVYRKKKIAALPVCILYTLLFGFELRLLLFIITIVIDRFEFDRIDKTSLKVILVMLINHQLLRNYSFLIGFVFSLMSLLGNRRGSMILVLVESYFFKEISFLHIFALPFIVWLRIISFIMTFVCFLFPVFSPILMVYLKLQSLFYSFDRFSIRGTPNIIIITILLLTIILLKIHNEKLKLILYCALLLLPLNQVFPSVDFIDVAQGDAILISGAFGSYNVLIDTGSPFNYSKLKNHLYSKGIYRIDRLITTHDDADHNGNVERLMKDFDVGQYIYEKGDVTAGDLYLRNIDSGEYDNDNANSLVYYAEYHGLSFLFTGDITRKTEMNILALGLIDSADVLKVSHHGSDTATSDLFLSRILPRFAIISTSGAYDHPKKTVLDALSAYRVKTLITKDSGTVSFVFTGIRNFIKTAKGNFVIID